MVSQSPFQYWQSKYFLGNTSTRPSNSQSLSPQPRCMCISFSIQYPRKKLVFRAADPGFYTVVHGLSPVTRSPHVLWKLHRCASSWRTPTTRYKWTVGIALTYLMPRIHKRNGWSKHQKASDYPEFESRVPRTNMVSHDFILCIESVRWAYFSQTSVLIKMNINSEWKPFLEKSSLF